MRTNFSLPKNSHQASAKPQAPRFYSVAEVGAMFGISAMTLYRAIKDGEFPAIKIRGRFIVPAKAVEAMAEAAMNAQAAVDASAWASPNGASHG